MERRFDPEDHSSYYLSTKLDSDAEKREAPARVALKRYAPTSADSLERMALICSSAFVHNPDDHADYDTREELAMDIGEPDPHHNERAEWVIGRGW